ncbi:MAG: thioredoxin [Pseudomonadota bacterium]
MEPLIGGAPAGPAEAPVDANAQNFMAEVVEESRNRPVLVDFWAPWCQPCKTLTPIIEKAVAQTGGKVKLVKVNLDENQMLAQQMQVQSVPTVYAFVNGQPVDAFQGAVPESQVTAFIDKVLQASGGGGDSQEEQIKQYLEMAKEALGAGDVAQAANIYSQIAQADQSNIAALTGLATCHIKSGNLDQAEQILTIIPPDKAEDSDVKALRASLELAKEAEEKAGQLTALAKQVADHPEDHQARFELAQAEFATGDHDAAVTNLLHIIQMDREWNEGAAREKLLQLFDSLGADSPFVLKARRRLSSILFS